MIFLFTLICYFSFSFLFSASEAAKFALRDKSELSPLARGFVDDDRKSLAALVLGNNKANILVGQILGQMVGDYVWAWLQGWPWAVLMLILTVVFGEYVPKAVGEARPAKVLNTFALVLVAESWLMTPAITLLGMLNKWLPEPLVNKDEEELVHAAQSLDSISVSKIMAQLDSNPVDETLPKIIKSMRADEALKLVHDEGPQLVINDRGVVVGIVNRHVAFQWLFDHYDC